MVFGILCLLQLASSAYIEESLLVSPKLLLNNDKNSYHEYHECTHVKIP